MSQQNNNQCKKNNTLFNTDVSTVFVVKNAKRRSFIEEFNYTSINFTQKELGTILGFFIVRDHSTSSENIVNFLASEVKKHYFSPVQKPIEEKFESTLHHINRALEELANVGNVDWLGTIDGAVCAIDQSSIHFSVTGTATILLLRNNMLLDISEGLASTEAADYPLKTFVDISSGALCAHDKIIITSQELLELVSLDELQKNAHRMGQKNFIQFIETVLTNECTIASTTIIDVIEEKQPMKITATEKPETDPLSKNFFGANTFVQENEEISPIDIDPLIHIQEEPKEYVDPRTGHIHMQGSADVPQKPRPFDTVTDFLADVYDDLTETTKKQKKTLSKKISSFKKTTFSRKEEFLEPPLEEITKESFHVADESISASLIPFTERAMSFGKHSFDHMASFFRNIARHTKNLCHTTFHICRNYLRERRRHDDQNFLYTETTSPHKNFLPDMRRIATLWHAMSQKTKLTAVGTICIIIIAPLIISIMTNDTDNDSTSNLPQENVVAEQPPVSVSETPASPAPIQNTNDTLADPISLLTSGDIQSVITMHTAVFGIESHAISLLSQAEKPKFPLPSDAGSIRFSTAMPDLNMIFVITDTNKMYTFSPTSPKFIQQNNIPQINQEKIKNIGTFMTYLYIISDTMIHRYARVENGFDSEKEWLKKSTDLQDVTSLAIGESIYIAQAKTIQRFTQGNADNITLDDAIHNPTLLFTVTTSDFLWIIDTENNTLYKVDKKNHAVQEKYTHENFADAVSLSIDESSQIAYISTKNTIFSYSLKK